MTKVEFDKWVDEMIEKYGNDENILVRRFGYKTYIGYNSKTNNVEIARCHPDDEFNDKIGIAIAYARCKGIEVPKITECFLNEMKYGEKFKYEDIVYVFLCKIPDSKYYAVKEEHSKCRLFNFTDVQVEMVE